MNGKTPQDLYWSGRVPDQVFLPDELLYFRVPGFNEHGNVDAAHIPFPDTSVNRSKYSSPEHLLLVRYPQFIDQKVAQFFVRDIPSSAVSGDKKRTFDIKIVHDPVRPPEELEENYAHSEIQSFDGPARCAKLSRAAEKYVREILGRSMNRAL